MSYAAQNTNDTETEETSGRGELKRFEQSPKLAELKVTYRSRTKLPERHPIRSPKDAADYLRAVWNKSTIDLVEEVVVLCLNGNHQATGWVKVASGGFTSSAIDPRLVFGVALQTASSAIVLAHNHPSGSLEPSAQDRRITGQLKDAGQVLGIAFLDHIILTRDGAYSLAEERSV